MTTSVSSRQHQAPFLKFSDSVPEWTVQDNDNSNKDQGDDNNNSNVVSSNTEASCNVTTTGSLQRQESLTEASAGTNMMITGGSCCNNNNPDNIHSSSSSLGSSDSSSIVCQPVQHLPHFKSREKQILSDFQDKKIYLFLDYDGTLTPIVADPSQAFLSERMRCILLDLARSNNVIVGIVTGRALSSVKRFVQITASENLQFLYAASHGFHIEAAGQQLHHKVGARYIPILREAALKISRALGHIPGLTLEDNEFSVSVHYRNCPPESATEVEAVIDCVLNSYPSLRKTNGKMVFELRINVAWDKGRAVMWLLRAMDVNTSDPSVRLAYIGDDLTDEDAFQVIRQYGNGHLAILVSDSNSKTQSSYKQRCTAASFFVDGTDEVAELLTSLYCNALSRINEPSRPS